MVLVVIKTSFRIWALELLSCGLWANHLNPLNLVSFVVLGNK